MIFIWTFDEFLLHFGYVLVAYLHAGVTGQIWDGQFWIGFWTSAEILCSMQQFAMKQCRDAKFKDRQCVTFMIRRASERVGV